MLPLIDPVPEQYINLLDIIFRKIENAIESEKILGKMYMNYKVKPDEALSIATTENRNQFGTGNQVVTCVLPVEGPLVDVMLRAVSIYFNRWKELNSGEHETDAASSGRSESNVKPPSAEGKKRKSVPVKNSQAVKKSKLESVGLSAGVKIGKSKSSVSGESPAKKKKVVKKPPSNGSVTRGKSAATAKAPRKPKARAAKLVVLKDNNEFGFACTDDDDDEDDDLNDETTESLPPSMAQLEELAAASDDDQDASGSDESETNGDEKSKNGDGVVSGDEGDNALEEEDGSENESEIDENAESVAEEEEEEVEE